MRSLLALGVVLALGACDGDNVDPDAGREADAGRDEMDAGMVDSTIRLDGLDGDVEVIVDDRGMPHIYASTEHDLMVVQGYLMARDRFIQMEFIRRGVTGRVAEVLYNVAPVPEDIVQDDMGSRFLGFRRTGREIYESLPATDPTRLIAEAFVEGINAYIDEVIEADGYLPPMGLEVFNLVRGNRNFGRWEPADIFALARYQAWNLSYDADADMNRTRTLAGVQDAFEPGDADERLAARAGIYADFWSERQARAVYTRDGFNDGTTTALAPGSVRRPRIVRRAPAADLPPIALLDRGEQFFERLGRNPLFQRDPHVGSNSWVVSGDLTESGNPILSNDPHLSLISPGVWWYVHLNTEAMGGDIDAQGVAFAGLPGVVLGYNRDLAWSATTTGYDVTDVYEEIVTFRNDGTPAEPVWTPVSVAFEDDEVNLTTIVEEIVVDGEDEPREMTIFVAPQHGPLIPNTFILPEDSNPPTGSMAEGRAMSVKYTGHEVTNELAFFTGLLRAGSIDDAFTAQDNFRVGAQNFSYATRTGDIAWSTESRIPVRMSDACTFTINADGTIGGISPLFVLPGNGAAEWTEDLAEEFIPHDRNPSRGYIATANQDNVGVTADGNPCNDGHYIGGGFDEGYRQGRIVQRLESMRTNAAITTDDMIALQGETESQLGNGMRDAIVAGLSHAIGDTSDDPVLAAAVTAAGAEGVADLTFAANQLMYWTFATPHGIGATDDEEIADSVATTLFNVTISRLGPLAFGDEGAAIGRNPGSGQIARMLEWSLMSAEQQEALPLYTYRDSYLGNDEWNDTVVWDDITTDAVVETRHERIVRAVLAAIEFLETTLGADRQQWRWGRLHAVRFGQIVPAVAGMDIVSIPPEGSVEFPIGFPRHGDYGAVDVGNFGLFNTTSFTHGSGASQRVVVEMTPDGPRPFNALPGGQSEDIENPHHADEAELWRTNQQPPLYFERADIEAHAESRLSFGPPQ
jgi:penicillin amidase